MVLSYGVIMFIFLLALVPAVATHNFNSQSKKRQAREPWGYVRASFNQRVCVTLQDRILCVFVLFILPTVPPLFVVRCVRHCSVYVE